MNTIKTLTILKFTKWNILMNRTLNLTNEEVHAMSRPLSIIIDFYVHAMLG